MRICHRMEGVRQLSARFPMKGTVTLPGFDVALLIHKKPSTQVSRVMIN